MDQAAPPTVSRRPMGLIARMHLSTEVFDGIEHAAYVVVGALLSLTALVALAGAGMAFWTGLAAWAGTATIATVIERLLFVLMLVEILHTVRASMRSGGLSAEPFLVVGLIACIRRVLVSTLESTEKSHAAANAAESEAALRNSMIELVVLGLLIMVMVLSIWMLRRAKPANEPV